MTTPLLHFDLDERRAAVGPGGPLAPLADALARELEPLLERPLPIPVRKARLTRGGGRCPVHGELLEFDPWAPNDHVCVRCGRAYQGIGHDDWWAMNAGLYTVERAVHAAALYLLRDEPAHAALSMRILSELADRYATWPNRDNVLGPTRPFFSTYLESIWLLNSCHALSLLEQGEAPGIAAAAASVRRRLIAPSASLIASYHEGTSNRQVWNEVAILSALQVLGNDDAFERRLHDEHGLFWLMEQGLLPDGSWYEGENYHLFAHRGLWYGVELLRTRAAEDEDEDALLEPEIAERYRQGFVTPFLGLLPDDTLPSRRDSQYAVSVRQWRFAEWCELGYAHAGDARLAGLLHRLYTAPADGTLASRSPSERARSTADAERNTPGAPLDRSDLSWRALLMAQAEPVPAAAWHPASAVLPAQGLALLRRDEGRTYVAVEGGHTGGGHGHPDRLALSLQQDAARWLEDPGTGSYVDRSLHWYRSTLAHAAPLFDRASQAKVPATLVAFEERGGAGWIVKRAEGLAPGSVVERSVVACDGYLVDILEWSCDRDRDRELTLPVGGDLSYADADAATMTWRAEPASGAGGLEDGFDFTTNVEAVSVTSARTLRMKARATDAVGRNQEGTEASLWLSCSAPSELVRAVVAAAPYRGSAPRHWIRSRASSGRIVSIWSWPSASGAPAVVDAHLDPQSEAAMAVVTLSDGTRATHGRAAHGWHIDLVARHARSSIDLERLPEVAPAEEHDATDALEEDSAHDVDDGVPDAVIDFEIPRIAPEATDDLPGDSIEEGLFLPLGSAHYVGTEESWSEAGEPTATVQVGHTATHLVVDVEVVAGPIVVQVAGAENPLDNERADINGDGLQWYVRHPDSTEWHDAGLLVPASDDPSAPDRPRFHALVPGAHSGLHARWRATDGGWAMRLVWPLAGLPVAEDGCLSFDLVINERPADRERRRGQLVLSGADGFGYLRGDRHATTAALLFVLE